VVQTSLVNVATRAFVRTGDNVLIGGVIITGSAPKTIVLRGIGASLAFAAVRNYLRDPMLTVYDASGEVIAENDNWRTGGAAIEASGLAPREDFEAAIYTTLAPGAYTVALSGVNGTSGIGVLELYDLQGTSAAISNLATRGKVELNDNAMIGGFMIGGTQPSRIIVRAIGPSLAAAGVEGALVDPVLELYNSSGSRIFSNDNWRSEQAQQIAASSLAPTDDREAAIVAVLPPGSYTAIVRGSGGATGVALIEMYDLGK
jgi:hypothetical protein